jgi:hypothetical protein
MPPPRPSRPLASVRPALAAACATLALAFATAPAARAAVTPPAASGWIDVTQAPYNAVPNDGIDDTAAIQQAIDDATINMPDPNGWGTYLHFRRIVYLPAGTYDISSPLVIKDVQDGQSKGYGLTLQGHSRDGTVLRLANNAADFQSAAAPRAVFSTAPYVNTAWGTNIAFKINVFDLTVDTGSGNPGAVGVRYVVNNQGSMRDVLVRSSDANRVGWAGIDMETWTIGGPALLKNVRVEGFDWGVRYGGTGHYSMTAEHLQLHAQRVGGIRNQGQVFSIRGLVTTNQVGPSVSLLNASGSYTNPGLLTLIDSSLSGSGAAAITVATNAGRVFVRDTAVSGYTSAIGDQGATVASVSNSEYASGGAVALFSPVRGSLRLPVVETPAPPASTEDRSQWVNITNHDGKGPYFTPGSQSNPTWGTTNHSARIQAAIDWAAANDRTTVYFPFGEYAIGSTVRVHGSVRRLVGNYAVFKTTQEARTVTDYPVIVFENLNDSLLVEQINLYPGSQKKGVFFVNRSAHDVTIRNAYFGEGKAYKSDGATGRLFLEDVAGLSSRYSGGVIAGHYPQFDFGAQRVWARQFDTEHDGLHARIAGGDLWVLGLKTEEPGTVLSATAGSRVEILGGLLLPSFSDGSTAALVAPAFSLTDASASIAITTHSPFLNGTQRPYYQTIVSETRGSDTRALARTAVPTRVLNASDKSVNTPLFSAILLDPDLVAAWSFTNGAADEIGGHGGTLVNGAQIVSENGNQVLSLDGVNDHLSVASVPALLSTNAFTVMCWVKSNTTQWNDYGLPLSYRNVFLINSSPFNKSTGLLVRVDNSWKSISVNMNSATLTQWNHLAVTYGNQTAKVYWNGQEIASGAVPGAFTPSGTNPLYFGRDQSNRFFNGRLDDVKVYKRALTAAEIQTIIAQ